MVEVLVVEVDDRGITEIARPPFDSALRAYCDPSACAPYSMGELVELGLQPILLASTWHFVFPDFVLIVRYPFELGNRLSGSLKTVGAGAPVLGCVCAVVLTSGVVAASSSALLSGREFRFRTMIALIPAPTPQPPEVPASVSVGVEGSR